MREYQQEIAGQIRSNLPVALGGRKVITLYHKSHFTIEAYGLKIQLRINGYHDCVSPLYFSKPVSIMTNQFTSDSIGLFTMISEQVYYPMRMYMDGDGEYTMYTGRHPLNEPRNHPLSKINGVRLKEMLGLEEVPGVLEWEHLDRIAGLYYSNRVRLQQMEMNPKLCRFYRVGELMAEIIINRMYLLTKFSNAKEQNIQVTVQRAVDTVQREYSRFNITSVLQKVDAENAVYFGELTDERFKDIARYVQVNDTPQSGKAGTVGRLKDGVEVKHSIIIKKRGAMPVSKMHSWDPLMRHLHANRGVVRRALKESMSLVRPDESILKSTRGTLNIPSVNAIVARGYWKGTNMEDGIGVREGFLPKLKAVEEHIDTFQGNACFASVAIGDKLYPKQKIGRVLVEDEDRPKVTSVKTSAIVQDIQEDYDGVVRAYRIRSQYVSFAQVGSKLSDSYGNKGTISKVIPDKLMPQVKIGDIWVPVDMIMSPEICKREAPAVEFEEKLSIMAVMESGDLNNPAEIAMDPMDRLDLHSSEDVQAVSNVTTIKDTAQEYEMCFGIRRIFRLNHNSNEKARVCPVVKTNEDGESLDGLRVTDGLYTLIELDCKSLLKEVYSYVDPAILDTFESLIEGLGYEWTALGFERRHGILRSKAPYISIGSTTRAEMFKETKGTITDTELGDQHVCVTVPSKPYFDYEKLSKENITRSKDIEYIVNAINRKNKDIKDYLLNPNNERYLVLPKGTCGLYKTDTGVPTVDRLQGIVMNITNNALYFNRTGRYQYIEQMNENIIAYRDELCRKLLKKSGLMREITYPRIPGMSAVISGNPDLGLHEVQIPWKFLRRMAVNPKIAAVYGISCAMDVTKTVQQMSSKLVWVWRDPAHRKCNNLAMEVVVGEGFTIGVNPAVLDMFNGDLDGDMMQVYMPCTVRGYSNLSKMHIQSRIDGGYLKLKKHLKTVEVEDGESVHSVNQRVWNRYKEPSELFTIEKALKHNVEDVEPNKLKSFKKLVRGISDKDLLDQQITAAKNFHALKFGVAQGGGLGMDIRNMVMVVFEGKAMQKMLGYANESYHILAQAALDEKNSAGQSESIIGTCTSILKSGSWRVADAIPKLTDILPEPVVCMLMEELCDADENVMDIREWCAEHVPLFNCITARGSYTDLEVYNRNRRMNGITSTALQAITGCKL